MSPTMRDVTWPVERMGEAMRELTVAAGLVASGAPADGPESGADLDASLARTALRLGIEAAPRTVTYHDVTPMLAEAGPAILRPTRAGRDRLLVVLASDTRDVTFLSPDGARHTLPVQAVRAFLCAEVEAEHDAMVAAILDAAAVPEARRDRARTRLMDEQIGFIRVCDAWLLRLPPTVGLGRQLRRVGLHTHVALFAAVSLLELGAFLASWWLLGRGLLGGRVEPTLLTGWALLLASTVPLRAYAIWLQGVISLGVGGLLKHRLLQGVMRLRHEEIRGQGTGHFLGATLEAAAVENLSLTGGFMFLLAALEILAAIGVLALGAGGWMHAALLALWVAFGGYLAARFLARQRAWTDARLGMTRVMVEHMIGYRTRLTQLDRASWHREEDDALSLYDRESELLEQSQVSLQTVLKRGWMIVGLAGVVVPFMAGASVADLAVAMGGVLLAARGLQRMSAGLGDIGGALVAWRQIAPIYRATGRSEPLGRPAAQQAVAAASADTRLLDMRDLVFRYRSDGAPVLRDLSLSLHVGERVLIEGPSGSGKSTLLDLLSGMRAAESGVILLRGLDVPSLGTAEWRRRVVVVPQFHRNHLFGDTLMFNLMLGSGWPTTDQQIERAYQICGELGLGPLLQRMPGGLWELVGETGWQLSHGERSRVFVARALLQDPDVLMFDESFAALDPETLQVALTCILKRARTLVVVAHP